MIKEHYQKCKALIFPGEEDFGITPLEAMASGRPVIAYGKGGVLETVIDGKTGVFFAKQDELNLIDAVEKFERIKFSKIDIRKHAEKFDEEIFKHKMDKFINSKYDEFKKTKKWVVIDE